MGGGRGIKTPFGIFFGSNITPHPEKGIGRWSDEDFIQALTLGMAPDGRHYFPVFPYTSFRLMNKEDLLHLKDYLFSLPISSRVNTEHDVPFPFNWRPPLFFWKLLFLEKGSYQPDPSRSKSWNRGAYLSNALAHCGECHTPRNLLGGLNPSMHYAGSEEGPEGELTPTDLLEVRVLHFHNTQITDEGLKEVAKLKELKGLYLLDTKITDTGLKEVAKLQKLISLGLENTQITDGGVAELKKALPNCNIIGP